MEIEIREIEGKGTLSLLPLWNNELGSLYVNGYRTGENLNFGKMI